MRMFTILLAALIASVSSENIKDRESLLVHISSGLVRGYKDIHEDVFVFNGIPYATAPTGTERFKGPLPPPSWLHQFEAVDDRTICPQITLLDLPMEGKIMKEDCLIANVYVPRTESKNLSVVVYVHGGGFVTGYGNMLPPKKLVRSQNVIGVTFNYRLGAHGFLCLGTEDVPGNAGMKDQVALLRWVKKNIAGFGGNPNEVTIAGYSAGSASVDLLMLSKMAEGLFNKVIPESGVTISPFTVQIDPIQNAKKYARLVDIHDVEDLSELENIFKKMPYQILQSGNALNSKDFTFPNVPCVEKDNGQEMFLKEDPMNILKRGDFPKLPILHGFANMEGLMSIHRFDLWKKEMNENFADFLPADLNFKSKESKALVAGKLKEFYFGDKLIDYDAVLQYVDFMSDGFVVCPTLRAINYLTKAGHNEIYLYEYSYTDEYTPFVPHTTVRGADHCAQSFAVLDGLEIEPFSSNKELAKMKSIMRELWGNFIKNGKPTASGTPVWTPVGSNGSPYMTLKLDSELRSSLLAKRCVVWNKIYESHYNYPGPPASPLQKHNEL
ncbi:esterase FE4-like [Danaus plexippus]|uniref:esterase FE4-like n=1 Tax=Danaus plexippus TaxID=13037 RepID=UPI002AB0E603|nr:esterase FE4-like [Danaus plexippus]